MNRKVCISLVIITAALASVAGAKSIFDDDWSPPKPSEAPKPIVVVKPPAPADPPKPAEPATTPLKDPIPAQPAAARRPVPAKADQAAVRKVLKEVFAAQLVDRSMAGRLKLTQALLVQADQSADAPVDKFVLLAAAIDAGAEAANLTLAFDAADRMAKSYEVDAAAVKVDAATRVAPRAASPDIAAANVKAGLELADSLVAADDLAAASRLCTALQPAAGGNAELRAQVLKRQRELTAAREAAERTIKSIETLKGTPDDPAANLAVGRYLCLMKGNWKEGLPMLAKGSDPAIKALASSDILAPATSDAQAALGDAWWDLAQAQPGTGKMTVQVHAAEWYRKALPELKGLAKAKADKRIAEVALATSRVVNLLDMIDVDRDAMSGQWKRVDGAGGGIQSPAQGLGKIGIRYQPPEEYDFRIEFTRRAGGANVSQTFTIGGRACLWTPGWAGRGQGFEMVSGRVYLDNPTFVKGPTLTALNQRYSSIVQVRKDHIAAVVDGKVVSEHRTDGSDMSLNVFWAIGGRPLGVGTEHSECIFHVIEIRELSGPGKPIQ